MKKTERISLRRNARIEVRIPLYFKQKLKNKAKEQNLTLTDFILCSINNALTPNEIKEIRKISDENILWQRSLANNINQIARKINYEGRMTREEEAIFLEQLDALGIMQEKILEGIYELEELLIRRLNKINMIT